MDLCSAPACGDEPGRSRALLAPAVADSCSSAMGLEYLAIASPNLLPVHRQAPAASPSNDMPSTASMRCQCTALGTKPVQNAPRFRSLVTLACSVLGPADATSISRSPKRDRATIAPRTRDCPAASPARVLGQASHATRGLLRRGAQEVAVAPTPGARLSPTGHSGAPVVLARMHRHRDDSLPRPGGQCNARNARGVRLRLRPQLVERAG